MTRYVWRPGTRISIDPQKAGEALARIEQQTGQVTAPLVVEAAKPVASPLHGHFEWDNSVAANLHREEQARRLISAISIDRSRSNVEPAEPQRVYLNVLDHGEHRYLTVQRIMSDADLRKQVLEKAMDDLRAWRRRNAELTELASIFAVIDATGETQSGSAKARKRV